MRIDLHDTPAAAVLRLAEGSQPAAMAMIALVKSVESLDPTASFGPFTPLVLLDRLNITGPAVAMLYHRVAGGDPATALALLHAVRLKLISADTLTQALNGDPTAVDGPATLVRVRQAMPGFAPFAANAKKLT